MNILLFLSQSVLSIVHNYHHTLPSHTQSYNYYTNTNNTLYFYHNNKIHIQNNSYYHIHRENNKNKNKNKNERKNFFLFFYLFFLLSLSKIPEDDSIIDILYFSLYFSFLI